MIANTFKECQSFKKHKVIGRGTYMFSQILHFIILIILDTTQGNIFPL